MGSLTGKQIDQTYDGLIKTHDEQAISATPNFLQDGLGNSLPFEVGTSDTNFFGNVSFDNATVTGITTTDTTYTLGVDESVPDGIITLQASDGSPRQEVVFQCDGNITMDIAVGGNTLDVTVAPYTIDAAQDGANVDIELNSTHGGSNVTLEAGTNITLTNTGNNILIDAAGGTDTNTTYDFDASQVGANSKLALTGSDATIDAVTLVAGTNITLTTVGTDVTIDAAGGGATPVEFGSQYRNDQYSPTMGGYPSNSFAKVIQPINGRPFLSQTIDQNDLVTVFSRLYGQVGDTMTTIIVPLFAGASTDVVVEWYRADATTGLPGTRLYTETFPEPTGVDAYYEFTLTTPQTIAETGDWWIGVRTSNDRKTAQISGDHVISQFYGWGGYGTSPAGISPSTSFFYNDGTGLVPTTIPSGFSWSTREELNMYFWK